MLLAQLLQKALLLKYRCPANDLQNGKGAPSLRCLPCLHISWPFAQGFCHLQIARAREDLSREGVGKGSHDGAEGRGKVAGSVGKIHKHIIERGRNFLCTGSSKTNGAKLSDTGSVRLCMGWPFCLAEMRREFQTGGTFLCTTLYI